MRQELLCRRIKQRPTGALPAPGRPNPTRIHQYVERSLRDLNAANGFDLSARNWFVIGNDRQRLGRGARQSPDILARAAQKMRKIRRGLEMPATAPLDELDAPALVMLGKLPER